MSASLVLTVSTAGVGGFVHALEIDHIIAVAAIIRQVNHRSLAFALAALWSLGHFLSVTAATLVFVFVYGYFPPVFQNIADIFVGGMLCILAFWTVFSFLKSRRQLNVATKATVAPVAPVAPEPSHFRPLSSHGATSDSDQVRPRLFRLSRPILRFIFITLAIGFVHGVGGSGAIVAVLSARLQEYPLAAFLHLLAFGLGSAGSMIAVVGLTYLFRDSIHAKFRNIFPMVRTVFAFVLSFVALAAGIHIIYDTLAATW